MPSKTLHEIVSQRIESFLLNLINVHQCDASTCVQGKQIGKVMAAAVDLKSIEVGRCSSRGGRHTNIIKTSDCRSSISLTDPLKSLQEINPIIIAPKINVKRAQKRKATITQGLLFFEYGDFRRRGFRIVAVLDSDPGKVGGRWGDVKIRPVEDLATIVQDEGVDIAILAVPGDAAQTVADAAVHAGVRGILNFAPVQLRVPASVSVQHVNMVMELEALSFELSRTGADGP